MAEFSVQNWAFENTSQPVCQTDKQGSILYKNKAFSRRFGDIASLQELGFFLSDKTPLNWQSVFNISEAASVKVSYKKNNTIRYFLIKYNFLTPESNQLCFIFHDFTARVRCKRLKAKITLTLKTAMDNYPIMLFGLDEKGIIHVWNKRSEVLTGYTLEDVEGKPVTDFFPDYLQQFFETAFTSMKGLHIENLGQREIKFTCKDGSIKHLLCMLRYDAHFVKGLHFFGLSLDLTEQVTIREALYKSEQRYYTISKATNDAIWDWDVKTDEIFWNEGITGIFGYLPDEVESTFEWWEERIHEEDRQRVTERIRQCISVGNDNWFEDYRFKRKDGSFAFVYDKGLVIKDENNNSLRMIGGMVDITERKIFEQNLILKNRQLSEFAFFNSHKLRSPLARLMGIVYLLRSEESLSPKETHELLERLIHSAEELDKMIRDMSNLLI